METSLQFRLSLFSTAAVPTPSTRKEAGGSCGPRGVAVSSTLCLHLSLGAGLQTAVARPQEVIFQVYGTTESKCWISSTFKNKILMRLKGIKVYFYRCSNKPVCVENR